MTTAREIYDEVLVERERQDAKWGGPVHDDHHDLADWYGFIQERLFVLGYAQRETLIEIAALAVAAVESIDRKRARDAAGSSR